MQLIQPKTRKSFVYSLLTGLFLVFSACRDNDPDAPRGRYERGVFIVNEGSFGNGNGEISFYDLDSLKVTNGIFGKENRRPDGTARPLGDVVQSMSIHNNTAYIIANNSNKIVVADAFTFTQTAEIQLKQPRYMVTDGNTGYVTEWVSNDFRNPPKGRVAIIDLQTNSTWPQDTISTDGFFPDQLVLRNKRLYVINSNDNSVSVLNVDTRKLESKTVVGKNPNGIVADRNNDIWVSVSGEADFSAFPVVTTLTPAKLLRFAINGNALQLKNTFTFPDYGIGNLMVNNTGDKLYYSFNKKTFEMPVSATTLPAQEFLNRSFYGIGIDPASNVFYGGVAPNFSSNGKMIRYNLATKAPIDSATVGISPNGFVFR